MVHPPHTCNRLFLFFHLQMEALEALLEHERGEGRAREQRHKLTVERLRRQISDLQARNKAGHELCSKPTRTSKSGGCAMAASLHGILCVTARLLLPVLCVRATSTCRLLLLTGEAGDTEGGAGLARGAALPRSRRGRRHQGPRRGAGARQHPSGVTR